MKTVLTVLTVMFMTIMACDTPEPTTTTPDGDTTSIDRDRMDTDTSMQQDTTMRQDTFRLP